MLLAPTFANGEKLSDVPAITFQVSIKPIALTRLSDFGAHEIVANKKTALINDGRSIWLFSGNNNTLEKKAFAYLPQEANWYGPVCAMGDTFVFAVQNYPEEQLEKGSIAPRGSFIEGPPTSGFVLLSPAKADRYLQSLTVTLVLPKNSIPTQTTRRASSFPIRFKAVPGTGLRYSLGATALWGKHILIPAPLI